MKDWIQTSHPGIQPVLSKQPPPALALFVPFVPFVVNCSFAFLGVHQLLSVFIGGRLFHPCPS